MDDYKAFIAIGVVSLAFVVGPLHLVEIIVLMSAGAAACAGIAIACWAIVLGMVMIPFELIRFIAKKMSSGVWSN